MSNWDTELRSVLKKHLEHDSTIAVVVAMYRAIRTMPRLVTGESGGDQEWAKEGGQSLMEHAFILTNSPFMAMFGAPMTAVYQLAVNSYTDSFHYQSVQPDGPEGRADNIIRQRSCVNTVHEITLMAVMCERGFGYFRQHSIEIRDALHATQGVI